MPVPDFLVIGHLVKDLGPDGWRPGGTVTFASLLAQRIGLSVGVVTSAGPDVDCRALLPQAEVICNPSEATTCFDNRYMNGHRRQWVSAKAAAITPADVPSAWRAARIVLVGPVCGEVSPDLSELFPESLVGVSAQGWLRRLDAQDQVRRQRWRGAPFWKSAQVLFVSEEDWGRRQDLHRWASEVPIVAFTMGWRGARLFAAGRWRTLPAFPAQEVDPTGAGDVFAAGFLVRLWETGDIGEAARFGEAAASLSVAAPGTEGIPTRDQIQERLARYPEIRLR
jgi:sugar/nucleoside kinase (ribokinase family)